MQFKQMFVTAVCVLFFVWPSDKFYKLSENFGFFISITHWHLCPEMQANEIQCSLSISITRFYSHTTSYLTESCVFVETFKERGHFVMPIVKSIHVINLHFWTSLLIGCSYYYLLKVDKVNITPCVYFKVPITSIFYYYYYYYYYHYYYYRFPIWSYISCHVPESTSQLIPNKGKAMVDQNGDNLSVFQT